MPARTLVLLRHAKSDYPPGVPDHDRPLAGRGRTEAPLAGAWLDRQVPVPTEGRGLVLVSTALRAQQTWQLASTRLGQDWSRMGRRDEPRIYEASADALARIVGAMPDDVRLLVMVGHNPGLSDLIRDSCVPDDGTALAAAERFPTSAIAVLDTEEDWAVATSWQGAFRARDFVVPRPPSSG